MDNEIREVKVEKDENGKVKSVTVVFGPHYFIEIMPNEAGKLILYIGATHHGFSADATQVGKGLEAIIEEVRRNHPELVFD